MDEKTKNALIEFLIRLADDRLVLGHRLSEWCGHAPELEEDIALTNIALDLTGECILFYDAAGELEGQGRKADDFAYFRDEIDFKNLELVEQPNIDFGYTIARQFFFDAWSFNLMQLLKDSAFEPLSAAAYKTVKEDCYHLRHSAEWIKRLGDGTEESHGRIQQAVDDLWRFTGEMFEIDEVVSALLQAGTIPALDNLKSEWDKTVNQVLSEATLKRPEDGYMATGARSGRHSEHLGHMLSEMQSLRRAYPEASW
ncbi:MAG: phenylacetate-CoA oxygenase subunit PaaI [Candidatus Dadabacteria bacterium]|nr:MAG: phenylacetate-CoA oxygenase subunit PaaI [Candidatus Dadabacteria bacterium]